MASIFIYAQLPENCCIRKVKKSFFRYKFFNIY